MNKILLATTREEFFTYDSRKRSDITVHFNPPSHVGVTSITYFAESYSAAATEASGS